VNLLQKIRDHARSARLADGTRVYLRPLRDADLSHANEFFARLSDRTKYFRFMTPTPTLSAQTLAQLVQTLHEARAAVVVAVVDHGHAEELVGGGRLVPISKRGSCEFALTIVDAWQGRGLGTVLLREVVRLARELGYRRIEGSVLTVNAKMLKVAQRLKFTAHTDPADASVTLVSRPLRP
jgi:acetyltransferase